MPKQEYARRELTQLKYLRSGKSKKLKLIADELGTPLPAVQSWKQQDMWDVFQDAPGEVKRRRAPDGSGGSAARMSRDAVGAGEYAALLFATFSEDEMRLAAAADQDKREHLRKQLALYAVREHRMLGLISGLRGSVTPAAVTIEDALTRVQTAMQRAIEALHRMDVDDERARLEEEKLAILRHKLMMDAEDAGALGENVLALDSLLSSPSRDRELDA